jgi:hypothetical protein
MVTVTLLRYRAGVTGHTGRTVHLVPMPFGGADTITALCGALLLLNQVETVPSGHGMPCTQCLLCYFSTTDAPPPLSGDQPTARALMPRECTDTTPLRAANQYRTWGWPVTLQSDRVRLDLSDDAVALIIPVPLAEHVTATLRQRRCPPPVLANPYVPKHHVLLAGERYGVELPWPPGVHRTTGAPLLPPTMTPHGPITWIYPPEPDALQHCREIDVITAIRFVLGTPPAGSS